MSDVGVFNLFHQVFIVKSTSLIKCLHEIGESKLKNNLKECAHAKIGRKDLCYDVSTF